MLENRPLNAMVWDDVVCLKQAKEIEIYERTGFFCAEANICVTFFARKSKHANLERIVSI